MRFRRSILVLLMALMAIVGVLFLGRVGQQAVAAPLGQEPLPEIEVEPELQNQLMADESTGYLIYFWERPDLTPAYEMDWEARGRFVVAALQEAAESAQKEVRAYLDSQGVDYQSFWIDNVIVVNRGSSQSTFNGMLRFPEIAALRARRHPMLHESVRVTGLSSAPNAVESNITHVGADQVWAMGYTGEGIVVANIDTGVRYTHEALVRQYRGTATGSDDYNWLGVAGGSPTPVDDNSHGSHTMGTILGEDATLTNRIGMAPGAQWIACDGCEGSSCPDSALLTCAQWIVAPYPDGEPGSANPNMRPHVVNNSWGDCSQSYDGWYQSSVDAWLAAGIYPVFSNGNNSNCGYATPPGLNTVGNPARYGNVTGVGSTGTSDGVYATHSNWGPTDDPDTINPNGYPNLKPQVVAPGVNIRSAYKDGDSFYGYMSGTSMSSPHVTGLVALMWDTAPCLIGNYAATETIMQDTATPIPYDTDNGDEGPGNVPNHATGWGEINALAAVQAAISFCELNVSPDTQRVCAPGEALYDVNVGSAYTEPVTLSADGHPAGTIPSFSVNPVSPPGSSVLTVSVTTTVTAGSYDLNIVGTSPTQIHTDTVELNISTMYPISPTLSSPPDGAADVSITPDLSWGVVSQAESYLLEIATDSGFTGVVYSATTGTTSHTVSEWLDYDSQYFWHVRSQNTCGNGPYSGPFDFVTQAAPPILLVDDDDNSPNVQVYYTTSLDALGYSYEIWDTLGSDNEPDASTLSNYEIVVWFTGDSWGGYAGPGSAGESALGSWLDTGKCLLISSQDYQYDRGLTSFMDSYLGVTSVTDYVGQTSVTGAGSVFGGLGSFVLSYPFENYSDSIIPDSGVEVAFTGTTENAAVNKHSGTYKTTFWGFPFEALPTAGDRQEVMNTLLEWCEPSVLYLPIIFR